MKLGGQPKRTPFDSQFAMDAISGQLVVRLLSSDVENDDTRVALVSAVHGKTVRHQPNAIVFDISGHDFLCSSTLGALLSCRVGGVEVSLTNTSDHVMEILERTRLCRIFCPRHEYARSKV